MAKTSRKSAKVGRRGGKPAVKRVAAKSAKQRKNGAEVPHKIIAPQGRSPRQPEAPLRRQPADREGLRRRPRAGLHRGHAGLETRRRPPPRRDHRADRPRRVQGRQMELAASTASRARAGSSASIASRSTSRWPSSAAHRCVLSRPASPSKRKCATSTSTRTTSSTKLNSPLG